MLYVVCQENGRLVPTTPSSFHGGSVGFTGYILYQGTSLSDAIRIADESPGYEVYTFDGYSLERVKHKSVESRTADL